MSRILLVRHGQASLGAANYDALSATGHQQSRWLGEYLHAAYEQQWQWVRGDLQRHQETLEGILSGMGGSGEAPCRIDARWNEFDFQGIVAQFLSQHPEHHPNTNEARAYFKVLRLALAAWASDALEGDLPESWSDFQTRIVAALDAVSQQAKSESVIVVTSGGAMAMALQSVLRAPNETVIDLNLQTRNTAVTELRVSQQRPMLVSFNTLPHLELPARAEAITYA